MREINWKEKCFELLEIGPARESQVAMCLHMERDAAVLVLTALEEDGLAKRVDAAADPLWAVAAVGGMEKLTLEKKEAEKAKEEASEDAEAEQALAAFLAQRSQAQTTFQGRLNTRRSESKAKQPKNRM